MLKSCLAKVNAEIDCKA
jgi:uncharacterized membrane protein YdjX (TVP38/TMEM64 family)